MFQPRGQIRSRNLDAPERARRAFKARELAHELRCECRKPRRVESMRAGDRYQIRNATLSGAPIVEGVAMLVNRLDQHNPGNADPQRWRVNFGTPEEPDCAERLVYAADRVV
jgi:hypothetical protein